MIRMVIADDHEVVRRGLEALLGKEMDFIIIAEARNGLEAIDLVEKLQPDILVLDLMMVGINGLDVTRRLSHKYPNTGIVILSMYSNEAYVLEALHSGAKAYILKESPPEELIHAIREVAAGGHYLSPPLTEKAIEDYARKIETVSAINENRLTRREKEIFHLVARGRSNAGIASSLYISLRTVETHRGNLMRKLGLHDHAGLIRYAAQIGLITRTAGSLK